MGVTVREKDGAWWIFVNHQGKRKARRVGAGDAGRNAARKAAEKIQAKLVLGDLSILEPKPATKNVPTFRDVAANWEMVKYPDLKRGTRIDYASMIRKHFHPAFGDLPITEVTGDCVEAWWVRLRNTGYSKKHLTTLRSLLTGIFRWAVSKELLPRNPADRIAGRIGRTQGEVKKKTDHYTAEEVNTFLETTKRVCPKEYPVFLVIATGGLRVGEAVALQVGDLDVAGLRIHIRRTVRRGYVDSPKNGEAGIVDIPPTTMEVLRELRDIRQVEAAVKGTEARWLFVSKFRKDKPITPEAIGQAMKKVVRAAGLREIRVHDLRHTYATLAIQGGAPLLNVSRQLRHGDIGITAKVSVHAVPGGNKVAADIMEHILAGNQAQPPRNQGS